MSPKSSTMLNRSLAVAPVFVCMTDLASIIMLRSAVRSGLGRLSRPSLLAPASCLPLPRCSRTLSSSSWRPGARKPFAAASADEEDEEEVAARKAHEAREAAWKAEQAAQDQRRRAEEARKRNASSSSSSTAEPSILEQLHLSSRSAPRRSALSADADPDATPSLAADPAPAPGSPLPDLKTQLRAFLLLSHPDMFDSHPSQKETNSASLALLSDFLDALRGNAARQPNDKHKTAKVQFWLRKKIAEGAAEPVGDAAFYSVSTTLVLGPASKGNAGQQQQLYASLSSLFKQAGIRNATHWKWGDEYEDAAAADSAAASDGQPESAARTGRSDATGFDPFSRHTVAADSSGSPAAAGGSLDTFLRAERARAHHFELTSRPARHDFLLRMANLRLQGVRLVFESSGGGVELDQPAQRAVLGIFEATLRKSRYFKPPRPIASEPFADAAAAQAAQRAPPTPWGHASGAATDTDGGFEPQQPSVPFSQSAKMPEGFAGIFQQIKRHAVKEEEQQGMGEAAKAEARAASGAATADTAASPSSSSANAAPDSSFESRRSPFSRVASVFSSDPSVRSCHVDGRGRLVFSLHAPASTWLSFIDSSPLLIDAALATQRNFRGIKTLEKHTAEAIGIFDLFAEPSLMSGGSVGAYTPLYAPQADRATADLSLGSSPSPAYQSFLSRLHSGTHQMHSLRASVKDLSEVSIRVFVSPPSSADSADQPSAPSSADDARALFSVDPDFGLLLVPLSASVADIKSALLDRGAECVAIRRRQLEVVTALHDAMLHAKRHLKLRALTQAPTVTRDQMLECVQRLSRLFGPMRDLLQATSIHVGPDFELREDDGTLVIPWNWS